MPNIIKQIVKDGEYGTQTIKMIVRANERGATGEQGPQGEAATITAGNTYTTEPGTNAQVMNSGSSSAAVFDFYIPRGEKGEAGKDGEDGAIHYTAGSGIQITPDNVINATGGALATWGDIQGTLSNQTDLQSALNAKQGTLTAGSNITLNGNTISATNTTYTAGSGLSLNGTAFSVDTSTIAEKSDIKDATLTIQNDGTNVSTFTANASANVTANIVPPVKVGSVISEPTDVAFVDTVNIVDKAVTADKLDETSLPGRTFTPVSISDTKSVGSTWTDFGTYNVATTGLYMLRLFLDSEATSTNHNSQARVMNGATEIQVLHVWPSEAWSGNYFCRNSDTWVFWLTAGDTLTLQGKQNNWTGNLAVRLELQQIY